MGVIRTHISVVILEVKCWQHKHIQTYLYLEHAGHLQEADDFDDAKKLPTHGIWIDEAHKTVDGQRGGDVDKEPA